VLDSAAVSIATRVTLLTVLLIVMSLGLYGFFSLRARHAELVAGQEQNTRLFASALTVALEGALQDGLFEDVPGLIRRMQAAERTIEIAYLDFLQPQDSAAFGGASPAVPADATRTERRRRVEITGQPYGEHVEIGGRAVYAYMFPLRGSHHQIVAAIDLIRPDSVVEREWSRAARDVMVTLGSLSLLLILLLGFLVRQEMTRPLLRLVGGIDEVSRGDYTGAILRERNDEVGLLADRFNEMTRSLRQAREEILAGVDAKLQLEQRLRHSDKLATIGQLAAGIAHEVGTPLNVIGGRARVMAKRAEDPQAVQKNAEIIASQAERITKIIQQLLDYARRKSPARAAVDLRRVCSSTLDFLEHQLQTRSVAATLHPFAVSITSAETGQPPQAPVVTGDADQLQQVCLNLCINAIQAMPDGGGRLDLHLEGLVRRKPGLDRARPGAYVMLAVADTGIGIDDVHLGRIFEPFYSTKNADSDLGRSEAGRTGGSGLGLSVSAGIIKDLDGWIECERRPPGQGGGTIFRVFLPAPESDEVEALATANDPRTTESIEAGPLPVLNQAEEGRDMNQGGRMAK
jgi:signal transduction histidine kinase